MTLDLVRGVAVMGILAANIAAFGLPEPAYYSPAALGKPSWPDLVAWALTFVFVEGKMRGLFTLLFGASMLLVIRRASAAGDDPAWVHHSRMAWLFMFGLAHLYLFWWGDILAHYALVGSIAFAFHRLPTRWLVVLAALCFAIDVAEFASLGANMVAVHAAAQAPDASTPAIVEWQRLASAFGQPGAREVAAEVAAARGNFVDMVRWRWTHDVDPLTFLPIGGVETLGYMLAGMAALRSGFITGAWSRVRYRRVAIAGMGVGIAGHLAIAAFAFAHDFDARHVFLASLGLSTPLRPVMVAGYASLVILWARSDAWLTGRIAAAGRMALSNYLGTTLVCTTLFYGYGLGLFARIGRAELYGVVAALWVAMLAWSAPWLRRFHHGPFEWLWRTLARAEVQPFAAGILRTIRRKVLRVCRSSDIASPSREHPWSSASAMPFGKPRSGRLPATGRRRRARPTRCSVASRNVGSASRSREPLSIPNVRLRSVLTR